MKSVKEEFPNPVLMTGGDDYTKNCKFCTSLDEISDDNDIFNIKINYSLECKGLTDHIKCGKAVCVVLVKSNAASYSRLYKFNSDDKSTTIPIPKYDVVNKIEVTGSIIAAKEINGFRCEDEFNKLYFGDAAFKIRKGDILAIEESKSIYLDYLESEKPMPSIFWIIRDHTQSGDISTDFDDDKIGIHLNDKLYDLYYKFNISNNEVINRNAMGIIIYPVLVEAISRIKNHYRYQDGDPYMEDRGWFRTIKDKAIKSFNINLEETEESEVSIADKLLNQIVLDSLSGIKEAQNSVEDNQNEGEIN